MFSKISTLWPGTDRGRQQRLFKELVWYPTFDFEKSSEVKHCIANDPSPVPDPSPTHGSYHWTFER